MVSLDSPRYRPNPTRLTATGARVLESARSKYLPRYTEYTKEGFRPVGALSQFDPFILRRGKDLHVQAARTFASEQVIAMLEDTYRRRGRDVEVIAGRGAVLIKSGRRQQNVSHEGDVSVHASGVTFYVRERHPLTVSLGSATIAEPVVTKEPILVFPLAYASRN